jgi:hypothetical protein
MNAPRLPLLLLALLSSALSIPAFGKTADAYFHGGAYKYVAGKHQEASVEVEEGLRHYPDDKPLQKLAEQIRKMKDPQNNKGGKGDDKKKDDKGKKDPDKDKKDGDKKPDENKDKKDDKDGKKPPEPKDDGKEGKNPSGAPPPGQMSEEEAQRLLNSFADDEKKEQRERQKRLRKRMETDQDW